MTKFDVGDRVRVGRAHGVVIEEPGPDVHWVRFDDGHTAWFPADEIKPDTRVVTLSVKIELASHEPAATAASAMTNMLIDRGWTVWHTEVIDEEGVT